MFIARDHKIPSTSLDIPIAFFWSISILAVMISIDPLSSLPRLNKMPLFFLPYLMANNINEKKLLWLIQILILSTMITSVLGIYFNYKSGLRALISINNHTIFTPNTLAMFLLMVLPFAVVFSIYAESIIMKLINGLISIVVITCIILTYGRATYLALLIIILFGLFIKRMRYISLVIICILIGFSFIFPASYSRLKSIVDKHELAAERVYMWKSGLEMFKDAPLKGWGIDSIDRLYPKYKNANAVEMTGNLHNNYIQESVEKGIFGLIAFLWMLGSFFYLGINTYKKTRGLLRGMVLAFILSFTGFVIVGFFESNLFVPLILRLWLFILGICLVINNFSKNYERENLNQLT
jgi:O-antigen ligase